MSRFIAIHTMPMNEEQFTKAIKAITIQPPKGVSWKQSYIDFKAGKFFCEWESPAKEPIEEYFKTIKMPFDAVYPVRLYDVGKGKFLDKA